MDKKLHYFPLIIFFTLLFFHKTSGQKTPNEKKILLNIKSYWRNPPSLSSWNLTEYHCNFAGIHCSNNGFVDRINLYNCNISFPIPSSICELKDLTFLNLSDNNIPGEFPIFLYNCSNLQELDISQNYFSGELPIDIDKMSSNLTHLVISGNNFTGDIPPNIGRMPAIKLLDLSNNLFNGTIPVEMGNLLTLETLFLAYNPFPPAKILPELGNLTSMKYLMMSKMNLLGEIPDSFGKLVKLEHLYLAMNSLVGEIPGSVWMIKSLKYLYLFANKLTGEISSTIGANGLVEIDLSKNKLNGSIPEAFGELQNLTILSLYYNNLSGEIPTSIAKLPNLYDIRLFNNRLEGILPPEMGKYSPLWNFEVDDNMFTGELPENLCYGKELTCLIVFNNKLTGKLPESLGSCDTLLNVQIQNNQFTGEFPAGIWSAINLSLVITNQNDLNGTLPEKFPGNLTRLEIKSNRFSGNIPSSAGNLVVFLADNNKFSGEIPASFFEMSSIDQLSLSQNQISGKIPEEIGTLKHLTVLNLSNNKLSGQIPNTMGSMKLNSLDLSNNLLSGDIPSTLGALKFTFLNLSFNDLSGEIPSPFQNQAFNKSFLANPNLCAPFSISNIHICKKNSKKISTNLLILFSIISALIFSGVLILIFLIIKDRRKHKNRNFPPNSKLTSFQKLEFNESAIINKLTENNLIGSGGSSKVYRVSLNQNTNIIAVKKININSYNLNPNLEKQFEAEVKILSSIRHANIVNLLCCISGDNSKLLVYEYLEKNSLDKWLHNQNRAQPLDWPRRVQIALDSARGLSYMHHDCVSPIIHRDVKSSNILLDSEFNAKIADFGLARILEKGGEAERVSGIVGSFGYIAPECSNLRKVNEKIDVYSFGVVLLELVTGKEARDGGEEEDENLTGWAWRRYRESRIFVDEEIEGGSPEWVREAEMMFKLGIMCTVYNPAERPTMKEVVKMLMKLKGCGRRAKDLLEKSKMGSRRKQVVYMMEDSDESVISEYVGILSP